MRKKGCGLRAADRLDRPRGRDLAVAVETGELLGGQPVEVRHRAQEPFAPEPPDELLADAVDVHCRPDPVDERLETTGRAGPVRTAMHRLALGLLDRRAAERALRGHPERPGTPGMREHRSDDLRDHVSGSLDDHGVPLANVLAVDVLLVVERRGRDGDAPDHHGLELRPRVEGAGSPDTDVDAAENGLSLIRGPLVRPRPARPLVERPEPRLLLERVDLDNDAVDLVVEPRAPLLPLRDPLGDLLGRLVTADVGVRAEAALAEPEERGRVSVERKPLPVAEAVDPDRELPARGQARVLEAQRAGGGVTGIRCGAPSFGQLLLLVAGEAFPGEVDLPAYLDERRRVLSLDLTHAEREWP